jgi:hypothetical protein
MTHETFIMIGCIGGDVTGTGSENYINAYIPEALVKTLKADANVISVGE